MIPCSRFNIGYSIFFISFLLISCKETSAPEVTLDSFEEKGLSISYTATASYEGDENLGERGICWSSESEFPTTNDNYLSADGYGTGSFFGDVEGLEAHTTYYFRAFIVGETGINYSAVHQMDIGKAWREVQYSGAGGYFSVSFIDEYTGQVAGDDGFHYLTTDGGASWTKIEHTLSPTILEIQQLNSSRCYLITGSGPGNFRKSTDGGHNWELQSLSSTENLVAMYFSSIDNGWVASNDESIFSTSDGGENWTETTISLPFGEGISDIFFVDLSTGFLCTNKSNVWKTSDGGSTWSQISVTTQEPYGRSIYFVDDNVGFMIAQEFVYKTTDGGVNWTLSYQAETALYNLDFLDTQKGLLVGFNGTILRTSNAGESWTREYLEDTHSVFDVDYTSDEVAYGAGGNRVVKYH